VLEQRGIPLKARFVSARIRTSLGFVSARDSYQGIASAMP